MPSPIGLLKIHRVGFLEYFCKTMKPKFFLLLCCMFFAAGALLSQKDLQVVLPMVHAEVDMYLYNSLSEEVNALSSVRLGVYFDGLLNDRQEPEGPFVLKKKKNYDGDAVKLMSGEIRNGLLSGPVYQYDQQGKLLVRYNFGDTGLLKFVPFVDHRSSAGLYGYLNDTTLEYYYPKGASEPIELRQIYKDGKKNGNWIDHSVYDRSWIFYGMYVDDLLHGPFKDLDEKGRLRREGSYLMGKKEGKWLEYFTDGKRVSDVAYHNDKLDGAARYYYDNGTPKSESHYSGGKRNGRYITWYESGKTKEEGWYAMGERDSTWKKYDYTGRLESETGYKKGDLHGISRSYYSNGQLEYELKYENGYRHGKYVLYHSNGQLHVSGTLRYDERSGTWKEYDMTGRLVATTRYEDQLLFDESVAPIDEIVAIEELRPKMPGDYTPEKSPFNLLNSFHLQGGTLTMKRDSEDFSRYRRKVEKVLSRHGAYIFWEYRAGKLMEVEIINDWRFTEQEQQLIRSFVEKFIVFEHLYQPDKYGKRVPGINTQVTFVLRWEEGSE